MHDKIISFLLGKSKKLSENDLKQFVELIADEIDVLPEYKTLFQQHQQEGIYANNRKRKCSSYAHKLKEQLDEINDYGQNVLLYEDRIRLGIEPFIKKEGIITDKDIEIALEEYVKKRRLNNDLIKNTFDKNLSSNDLIKNTFDNNLSNNDLIKNTFDNKLGGIENSTTSAIEIIDSSNIIKEAEINIDDNNTISNIDNTTNVIDNIIDNKINSNTISNTNNLNSIRNLVSNSKEFVSGIINNEQNFENNTINNFIQNKDVINTTNIINTNNVSAKDIFNTNANLTSAKDIFNTNNVSAKNIFNTNTVNNVSAKDIFNTNNISSKDIFKNITYVPDSLFPFDLGDLEENHNEGPEYEFNIE